MKERMNEKLTKPYNPQETEARIYAEWEQSGFFNPDVCIEKGIISPDAKPYTIVLPPPNVTGVLHMGHALMVALEDIFIRYHRMQGYKTLWIPGTDHAAIATQSKVEKEIQKKEKKSRYDLGREELLKRIAAFAQESHDGITNQVKALGASLDWSREAFTLDEKRNHAVRTVFKKMYDDGLIYRGHRIVNWDPKGQTTISDDEIVYEERKAILYTFKYSKDFPIEISTTRPETKVGDTAVAVHPDDPRYKEFVGKEFSFEFCGVPVSVKIIADKEVDMEFGTGALGVTPSHSQIDWAIAERHNLDKKQVINEYAKMIVGDERLLNKKATEAREVIAQWLRDEGLMVEEKEITQNISTAERTGGIVEPLPKLQWFIDVNKEFTLPYSEIKGVESGSRTTLKKMMRLVIDNGQIEMIPDYFEKTYFYWIDNLRDWCISRQIWYGHRIPVWYKGEEMYCGIEAPQGEGWNQDEDTLDTWFSSGIWTFSTLGWPAQTPDLNTYHPTQVLETGYDILPFWVARMILMTTYTLGTIPFEKVYLHGIVRDGQGRKLSKSLGNAMDPLDMIAKYSADATRMALISGTGAGTDSKISDDKVKGYRNFGNKLWNITRFILESTEGIEYDPHFSAWSEIDKALIEARDKEIKEATKEMEEYRVHLAAERLYQYAWSTLADRIIEESKPILKGDEAHTDDELKISRAHFLIETLGILIKTLHPFIPFVTEELWTMMPQKKTLLLVEKWPQ